MINFGSNLMLIQLKRVTTVTVINLTRNKNYYNSVNFTNIDLQFSVMVVETLHNTYHKC